MTASAYDDSDDSEPDNDVNDDLADFDSGFGGSSFCTLSLSCLPSLLVSLTCWTGGTDAAHIAPNGSKTDKICRSRQDPNNGECTFHNGFGGTLLCGFSHICWCGKNHAASVCKLAGTWDHVKATAYDLAF
jgi:hypothetical protein